MNVSSKFHLPQCFEAEIQSPLLRLQNLFLPVIKYNLSVTLFTMCVYECVMNVYTKFYFPTVLQS